MANISTTDEGHVPKRNSAKNVNVESDEEMYQENIDGSVTPMELACETPQEGEKDYPFSKYRDTASAHLPPKKRQMWRRAFISPERIDPFADGGKTPIAGTRSFGNIMREVMVNNDEVKFQRKFKAIAKKRSFLGETSDGQIMAPKKLALQAPEMEDETLKTPNVDHTGEETLVKATPVNIHIWDATPDHVHGTTTPGLSITPIEKSIRRSRWDETPKSEGETHAHVSHIMSHTPNRCSRWDESPSKIIRVCLDTPIGTPSNKDITPSSHGPANMNASAYLKEPFHHLELDKRNCPISDEELDMMLPPGFEILKTPSDYIPIRTAACKQITTPFPSTPTGFFFQTENRAVRYGNYQPNGNLPAMKPEDVQFFSKLFIDVNESELSSEERMHKKIATLLLKIKNGQPPIRKAALRQLINKAREFGAGPLFDQILPLFMIPTLEDFERHQLVKVIERILYKLEDLVRPYVHKILVVIEPMLIDEDYYARAEAREIISHLAKAVGLATMISTMRPDIESIDEYVRNTTSRAFAVVAFTLGIPALIPFLRAVCKSKKSWRTRHTGMKIVQQIAILMGNAILSYLTPLVEIVAGGLMDKILQIRTMAALAIAALAEAATPYAIESFDSVLKPLWTSARKYRCKMLAACLKAIGYLIPQMELEYASYYTREIMPTLIREFQSTDEEMKIIVLKVLQQCCATDGLGAAYIREKILSPFLLHFWNRRIAMVPRNYRQLVDTTVVIAGKIGGYYVIRPLAEHLKDESQLYRKMVLEVIAKAITNLGAFDIDQRLEEILIDGVMYAYQEQQPNDPTILYGFSAVLNQLGKRVKPYLPQICGTILWMLKNKSSHTREQAADLITLIAGAMKTCEEHKQLHHLALVLYESLGEEFPVVLGSILGALKAIVNEIGTTNITTPFKDLLPRLRSVLLNRHPKVQEACIGLVGSFAQLAPEYVSAREWMRISFQLVELLNVQDKAVRRATINTFGYIAKAIGPNDVLTVLLHNLKVQERRTRLCSTVAIAVVAEMCHPFTVLPALMNEYRMTERNVQNGVLKSISFLFEYIGEMACDYIYAISPLLEDALMDRDIVHRQVACSAIKHLALGVYGLGYEDVLTHLLNYVWPNVFETSPHMIQSFLEAIEGIRVSLGPIRLMQYVLQGLFHSSRKVRYVYWAVYNMLYIGSQDALVAGYPRIENGPRNQYIRYELDYNL